MIAQEIPSEVRDFLSKQVRSLLALELLLLLRADAARRWTVTELSRELRATNEWAEQELDRLIDITLVQSHSTADSMTVYSLAQPATGQPRGVEFAFGWLAAAYPERRFSIIQALYAPDHTPPQARPDALHQFAEAFKIRKEPPHG